MIYNQATNSWIGPMTAMLHWYYEDEKGSCEDVSLLVSQISATSELNGIDAVEIVQSIIIRIMRPPWAKRMEPYYVGKLFGGRSNCDCRSLRAFLIGDIPSPRSDMQNGSSSKCKKISAPSVSWMSHTSRVLSVAFMSESWVSIRAPSSMRLHSFSRVSYYFTWATSRLGFARCCWKMAQV